MLILNGKAEFINNIVINPNRIATGLNGHSEGAVTFSWGAGNLEIRDNYFYSKYGNQGVMGFFSGAAQHTDENLIVTGNYIWREMKVFGLAVMI